MTEAFVRISSGTGDIFQQSLQVRMSVFLYRWRVDQIGCTICIIIILWISNSLCVDSSKELLGIPILPHVCTAQFQELFSVMTLAFKVHEKTSL